MTSRVSWLKPVEQLVVPLPVGPQQEFAGTVTDAAAAVALTIERKKRAKSARNKVPEETFEFQCRAHKLPTVERQFRLLKSVQVPRKDGKNIQGFWRFDFGFREHSILIEIDGGIWMPGGGAHSHPIDITRNMTKRNDAALAGFAVLAFTPREVKEGHAIAFTQRLLASKGWKR